MSSSDKKVTCDLYVDPSGRLMRELRRAGVDVDGDGPLSVDELHVADMMHYGGDAGLRTLLALVDSRKADDKEGTDVSGSESVSPLRFLEVGSGFGGCSRYVAAQCPRATVTALEVHESIHAAAARLTARCPAVASRVEHICGDLRAIGDRHDGGTSAYDVAFAILVLLHLPDLAVGLRSMRTTTRRGGLLFIEDYFTTNAPSGTAVTSADAETDGGSLPSHDKHLLSTHVGCPAPPTSAGWHTALRESGWRVVSFEDMSATWTPWAGDRAVQWAAEMDAHVKVHGEEAQRMGQFYLIVAALFAARRLRGCRIVAEAE
eukprot:TRINITY_DN23581_c0_g1_i1.p2 TRINITY_DN23581_c0_g1~~TRINITY_DN23581_c0_g1_i1.p2  ORF type:complete len:318 (-),score=58.78 TRINITY_DN23581_c0_g1_i1:758-1711(-)